MRRVGVWLWLSLTMVLVLVTCNGRRASQGLVLGPLVQLDAAGHLRLVWWTDRPGQAAVRLESAGATVVNATSRAWHAAASPPLDRAWQHVADLPALPAGARVAYHLLLDGVDLTPGVTYTLRVPPNTFPLRLAIIGDFGAGTQWEQEVHDVIAARQPDLILTAGDNAYGRGRYDEFRARVFAVYGDLMAQMPFMPAIGNHDNYTQHARPYLDFFVLPENAWRPRDRERYYSFDVGDVHIVVLDTTDPLAAIGERAQDDMADWLAADLAATDKPWRIAVFHHPPYSAGQHGSHRRARDLLVPILEAGGVQFVFNGHEHDYQRTCPIRGNTCVAPEQGITYVITGGGGAWLRPTGTDWFTARAMSVHEAAFLTLERCRARLEVVDTSGRVVDTFTLQRCSSQYLPLSPVRCRLAFGPHPCVL